MTLFRRFAESPLYPIPLRGWHAGSLEPHVLEQHLRLAFDRAGIAEMLDMFDWASQRRFGGDESDYVERFEAMDLPLLVVAGANDDLAPPASVRPGFTRSRSRDKTYRALPLGPHRSARRPRRAAHDVAARDELARRSAPPEPSRGLRPRSRRSHPLALLRRRLVAP